MVGSLGISIAPICVIGVRGFPKDSPRHWVWDVSTEDWSETAILNLSSEFGPRMPSVSMYSRIMGDVFEILL